MTFVFESGPALSAKAPPQHRPIAIRPSCVKRNTGRWCWRASRSASPNPPAQAKILFRQMIGPVAAFREGQWEAIDQIANQRRRLLVGLRRDEVEQMRRYVEHKGCLMEFLARALDDPNATACGKCMNCTKHT